MSFLRVMNLRLLNSTPYRVLARDARIEYREGAPQECAAALLQNDADIALLPQASIFKHGFYNMLPYGTVATGAIQTAILFAKRPLEEIREILLDSSSETSVLLLRVVLAEFFPEYSRQMKFRVDRSDRILSSIDGTVAGFVIGDQAFKNSGLFPWEMDLASIWTARTGLPFLFASWAYRPGVLSKEQGQLFCEILREGLRHRVPFAREYAEEELLDRDFATRYISDVIQFEIDDKVRQGALKFCELGAKYNLLPGETAFGDLKIFDSSIGEETPFVPERKRTLLESALDDATAYRRLSVSSATLLVGSLSLTELLLLTSLRKYSREYPTIERLFRLSLTRTSQAGGSTLISAQEFRRMTSNLPRESVVLAESDRCDELSIESLKILFENQDSELKLAVLSLDDLELFASEEHVALEEILDRLQRVGIRIIDGKTPELFSVGQLDWGLHYLESLRLASRFGFSFITRIQVEHGADLEAFAIHLYHLRQLQEQTGGIIIHFVEWPTEKESAFSPLNSVELFARVFALSQLLLDNVPHIAISPLGYGAPVAELLVELGADSMVVEL